ncbi:MAG: hypothetical protein L0Z53_18720, partial [Acidobacteriales bacterium]|nr:hypothetical protein [Terriglobales bacterium]
MQIHDTFQHGIDPRWQIGRIGRGLVAQHHQALHLTIPASDDRTYSDAQISDYDPRRRNFSLKPPLRLTVTAHCTL